MMTTPQKNYHDDIYGKDTGKLPQAFVDVVVNVKKRLLFLKPICPQV